MNLDDLTGPDDNGYRPMNGAFKGRGRDYVSLLVCPVDRARLLPEAGDLVCEQDAQHRYTYEDGILRLFPAQARPALDAASEAHEQACAARGWRSPDEAAFKSLPQTPLPGYPETYWAQQAASTALLWRFLEAVRLRNGGLPVGPMGEVAVIHAGMGWLAYGLDVAGYTTLALDTRAGSNYGLGAYPIARYFRLQTPLDRLPLARGAFDWVIFQEGLARFGDDAAQQRALDQAIGVLRPGGWVAVVDAVEPSEDDVTTVHTLFEDAGLMLTSAPRRRGWRGRLLELRDRLANREPDVPPVLVAQKPRDR